MRARSSGALSWAVVSLMALGCESAPSGTDASGSDASGPDAGELDAALAPDAGGLDAGGLDAGGLDAASTDGGLPDAGSDAGPACPARPSLGLFVWSDSLPARRDEILALAETHEVTELYLHANLFYAGDVGEDVLAAWIAAAHARCIAVELLFGNAAWILPAGQREARDRTAWAVAFAAAHPEARPRGVHFDLEPQQLAGWAVEADHPLYVAHLADVLEAMTPVAEAGGLLLSADIGFFLDEIPVTRRGTTRPGHEWVTDAVSRVVVMDYRDVAEGGDYGSMISLAEVEVGYASRAGTPIVLAAETIAVSPEYVTFREEGLAVMERELAVVRDHFAAEPSFAGLAIHDERGLAALPP